VQSAQAGFDLLVAAFWARIWRKVIFLPTDASRDDPVDVTNCETAADGVFNVI
jgi:hypothetical protein